MLNVLGVGTEVIRVPVVENEKVSVFPVGPMVKAAEAEPAPEGFTTALIKALIDRDKSTVPVADTLVRVVTSELIRSPLAAAIGLAAT
jgi:hypothetical protein